MAIKKKEPIKNVAVVFRKNTAEASKLATEVCDWLKGQKLNVFSLPGQKISTSVKVLPKGKKNITTLDLIVVLGGDGTYLEAVRLLGGQQVPILGINMGSLGFLTETRVENIYKAVDRALKGKLERRPRSMLEVKVKRGRKTVSSHLALNDAVIERGNISHLIHLGIYREKQLVSELKADGLVISTPTGSTAYNLAAGGPILQPNVNAVVVTPICPHSLTIRPIIFHDNQLLVFRLIDKRQKARLTIDGQDVGSLSHLDEITIVKSSCKHYVLREPSHNYFDLLREKLKFGERN